MNKRFRILTEKYIEHELTNEEKLEFDNFLTNPECVAYLKESEKIEAVFKMVNWGLSAESGKTNL